MTIVLHDYIQHHIRSIWFIENIKQINMPITIAIKCCDLVRLHDNVFNNGANF